MRILLVTDWLRQHGGVEAYFATLRAALPRAGHEVSLLTSTAGDAAGGTAEYTAYGTNRMAAQTVLQMVNPAAVASVRRAVRAVQPDVALVGMFEQHLSPAVLHALGTVPTVLSVADYKPVCPIHSKLLPDGALCTVTSGAVCRRGGCVSLPHWLRDQPRYALIRYGLRRADRIVTCSAWMQRELAANAIAADVIHLPTPAVTPGFTRSPSEAPSLVFVGRLSKEKGVDLLLSAFGRVAARVPDARLRIVGDGDERVALERLAADLGLLGAVTFTGWRPAAEVEQELSIAWALVAPSRWAEPFGLVAIEAIVRGVPVIAAAAGGFAETVVPGRSGLLFPCGDELALAHRLEAVATGKAFPSRTLADDVIADATTQYSAERHISALEDLFAAAIERRADRRALTRSSAPVA